MIKLIAFDWNGTLLSDTEITVRAENKALKAIGIKPTTKKRFQETFDIHIIKYWENIGFTKQFVKKHLRTIEDVFHTSYKKLSSKARTRSGVKEVLRFIKDSGIKSVIYSNHDIPDIKKHLDRLKIEKFINDMLANPGDERLQVFIRHKEQKLHNYCAKNKLKPYEIISVGDTEEEIEIGKKFGYHTVGITGGYNSTARLKKHHPDFLIHNMKDLIGIIKKLNS